MKFCAPLVHRPQPPDRPDYQMFYCGVHYLWVLSTDLDSFTFLVHGMLRWILEFWKIFELF